LNLTRFVTAEDARHENAGVNDGQFLSHTLRNA
jgi:hypothetical protein